MVHRSNAHKLGLIRQGAATRILLIPVVAAVRLIAWLEEKLSPRGNGDTRRWQSCR